MYDMALGIIIGKTLEFLIILIFGIFLIVAYFKPKLREKTKFISEKYKWLYLVLGIISIIAAINYALN